MAVPTGGGLVLYGVDRLRLPLVRKQLRLPKIGEAGDAHAEQPYTAGDVHRAEQGAKATATAPIVSAASVALVRVRERV